MKPKDSYLTPEEAGNYLGGVPVNTLAWWRHLGRGPTYIKLGTSRSARVRYPKRGLDAWLAAHTTSPEAGEEA